MLKLLSRFVLVLAATGLAVGCGDKDDKKDPSGNAPTASLSVTPASIRAGESVTLTWSTDGATSVSLVDDHGGTVDTAGKLSGSAQLQPEATTTWTLVAKNGVGETRKTAKVSVGGEDAPVITFDAQPGRIAFGGKSTLTWSVTGAERIVILAGEETLVDETTTFSGTLEVTPADTTTYVIEAHGPGGDDSASKTVEVAPKIASFETDATGPVAKGQLVTVSWETDGAESLTISNMDGWEHVVAEDALAAGSVEAPVGATGKFRLTATRGEIVETSDVTVVVSGAPAIRTFTADIASFDKRNPASVTLEWKIDGDVTSLELKTSGLPGSEALPVLEEGFTLRTIFDTTTFTLVAGNATGSVEAEVTVEGLQAPSIASFTTTHALVGKDDPFTLAWATSNATSVVLERDDSVVAEDLAPTGTLPQTLTASAVFTLRASNALPDPAVSTVSVTVGVPVIDSFEVASSQGAPGADVSFTWTATAATSVRVLDDSGEEVCLADSTQLPMGGCTGVVPSATAGFRLEASNGSGETLSDTVPFLVSSGPMIQTFTITPATASVDAPVTFHWVVTKDASDEIPTLTLEDDQDNDYDITAVDALNGSIDLSFDTTGSRTFTLTATTPGTTPAVATKTLQVVALPTVTSFTATPSAYQPSPSGVALAWQATNAASVTLHTVIAGVPFGAPIYSNNTALVANNGSFTVYPTIGTTYRVTVKNAAGSEATADATVTITGPAILDFSTPTPTVTAGSTATLQWNASGGTVYIKGMVEVPSANAPFVNIVSSGILMPATSCNPTYLSDEGCVDFSIQGSTFSFPFDGAPRTNARIYANGFISFDQGPGVSESYEYEAIPSVTSSYVNLAPYWTNLFVQAGGLPGMGMYGELRDLDPVDPHVIVMWSKAINSFLYFVFEVESEMNFEVVAFQSGSFEYRYGTMWADIDWWDGFDWQPVADGEEAVIGYQNLAGTSGYMMNPGFVAVPGGLSNRSFRAERNAAPVGSLDVVVRQTTTYELCVDDGTTPICQPLTVTAN